MFFDGIFTSNQGENMREFVMRLKHQELRPFRWMFPEALLQELNPDGLHGSSRTFFQPVQNGAILVRVHKHSTWRKKLFDIEVAAPPPSSGITAGVVTLGWMEDGLMFARVDNRRGSRAMCYLKSQWKGVSLRHLQEHPLKNENVEVEGGPLREL